jgi:hypothetical protein
MFYDDDADFWFGQQCCSFRAAVVHARGDFLDLTDEDVAFGGGIITQAFHLAHEIGFLIG